MNATRKSPLIQVVTWLVAEVLLSFVGLDTLADYGEFVFSKTPIAPIEQTAVVTALFDQKSVAL